MHYRIRICVDISVSSVSFVIVVHSMAYAISKVKCRTHAQGFTLSSSHQPSADLGEVVVENLEVDPKHHKAFFKHSAKLLKKVSQENGGVNIRFPRAGSKSDQVWLKGARKFVNTAKIAITDIVTDLESLAVVECIIPRKHHRTAIGAKGVNVQKLSKEYNVEIHFPPPVATDPRADVIVITGEEKHCLRAKEALLDLVLLGLPGFKRFSRVFPVQGFSSAGIESSGSTEEPWPNVETVQVYREYEIPDEKAKEALRKTKAELRSHRESLRVFPQVSCKHHWPSWCYNQ